MRATKLIIFMLLLLTLALAMPPGTQAQTPVVQAVLFYSPTCPHCEKVITEDLPPLQEHYGAQLEILRVDTTTPSGDALFQAVQQRFNPELRGVPTLVVGDNILVGSLDIPAQFPTLIETYLAEGGVGWPDLPGMEDAVSEFGDNLGPSRQDRYMQDPVGSTLSVIVLSGLIASLIAVAQPRPWQKRLSERFLPWGFIGVLIIGLIAASYLSYVETTDTAAICGPVGDCNAVQQSAYARLFGILPIAVFGLLGYFAIAATFAYGQLGHGDWAAKAPAVTFGLAAFGALFSGYLTFLEPFVIGATCMWCLTSAVSMSLTLLLTAGPGWAVLRPPAAAPAKKKAAPRGGKKRKTRR